ncbi:hypothetical protein TWF694_001855 [Orbilia ellipsospora]|uniref:Uncharacterized protein n=1 Tax=Orbilia ellipsospora TaxID=2528407 RepID=A0AAV9X6N7_9PEZI
MKLTLLSLTVSLCGGALALDSPGVPIGLVAMNFTLIDKAAVIVEGSLVKNPNKKIRAYVGDHVGVNAAGNDVDFGGSGLGTKATVTVPTKMGPQIWVDGTKGGRKQFSLNNWFFVDPDSLNSGQDVYNATFHSPSENLRLSGTFFNLKTFWFPNNTVQNVTWSGYLWNQQGDLKYSEYDLYPHIAPMLQIVPEFNGSIKEDSIYLKTNDTLSLRGLPLTSKVGLNLIEIDLSASLYNNNGVITYRDPQDEGFQTNSMTTQIIEGIPVIGYTMAARHYLNNETDAFNRAMASATCSTAVCAAGVVTGFLGGGLVACCLATTAATAVGGTVRDAYLHKTIDPTKMTPDEMTDKLVEIAWAEIGGIMGGDIAKGIVQNSFGPFLERAGQTTSGFVSKSLSAGAKYAPDVMENTAVAAGFSYGQEFFKATAMKTAGKSAGEIMFANLEAGAASGEYKPVEKWLDSHGGTIEVYRASDIADHRQLPKPVQNPSNFGFNFPPPASTAPSGTPQSTATNNFNFASAPAAARLNFVKLKDTGSNGSTTLKKKKKGGKKTTAAAAATQAEATSTGTATASPTKTKKAKKPKKTKATA